MKNKFKTWKTIKVGTGINDIASFCAAVEDAGMKVRGGVENHYIKSFTVFDDEMELDLTIVSPGELGLTPSKATPLWIPIHAERVGLEPCPDEVSFQLRLQYKEQPLGELLAIAGKKPIHNQDGNEGVATLWNHEGVLYLGGNCVPGPWPFDSRWVLVNPRR